MLLNKISNLGVEKVYGLVILIIGLCFACLVFVPPSSLLSSIFILLGFIFFGLLGIVCIYFKEMPGFGRTIKGTYAIITDYTFLIFGIVSSIVTIYYIFKK